MGVSWGQEATEGQRATQPATQEFEQLATLLDARRAELVKRLQGLEFGSHVTLALRYGEIRGRLQGCDESRVTFIGGRTAPVSEITEILVY